MKSLKVKNKVKDIDSVMATYFQNEGVLVAKIKSYREQANIILDNVFVILHFVGPPQHFSRLHIHKSESVYYDSLKNAVGRPFNEYPQLRNIGKIEIRKSEFYQKIDENGCMVVLCYWNLFLNKPYDLRGKLARRQFLKYYMENHTMPAQGSPSSCEVIHKKTKIKVTDTSLKENKF